MQIPDDHTPFMKDVDCAFELGLNVERPRRVFGDGLLVSIGPYQRVPLSDGLTQRDRVDELRARKWCSPNVNSPCTAGTTSSPARRSSISRSRRSLATASVPSMSSPAYGRASFNTTGVPSQHAGPGKA